MTATPDPLGLPHPLAPDSTLPLGLSISSIGPRMNGKDRGKKQYVSLTYTETQRRQLYTAATHRKKSPWDYIWDIIHDHIQPDLQRSLDDLTR